MLLGALALSKNPLEPPLDQKRLKTKRNQSRHRRTPFKSQNLFHAEGKNKLESHS